MSKNQNNDSNQKSGNESGNAKNNNTGTNNNSGTNKDQAQKTPKTPVSDDWKKPETDPNNPSAGQTKQKTEQGSTSGNTNNTASRGDLTTPDARSTGKDNERTHEEMPDREVEQDEE